MHAIGHQMLLKRPNAKIKYVSSENFNDLSITYSKEQNGRFSKRIPCTLILLVDDIQFE